MSNYPQFRMIEIYGGKNPEWKGWHNFILYITGEAGNSKPLMGPVDQETSEQIKQAIGNEADTLRSHLNEVYLMLEAIPEINPNNYDLDDVLELDNGISEVFGYMQSIGITGETE